MRTVAVLGKFMPMTKGHLSMIEYYSKKYQDDKIYVFVCYTIGETFPVDMRYSWVKRATQHLPNVEVKYMLEQLGSSEDGRQSDYQVSKTWAKWLKKQYPEITHFGGSEEYVKMMADSIGINYDIYDINREITPISATLVRSDIHKYKNMLAIPEMYDEYVFKIAVVGLDSCVDGDTEYFNGTQWKKISEYKNGDKVLQCEIDGSSAKLVTPLRYINVDVGNEKMYSFKTKGGNWEHVYSENHDVIVQTTRGKFKKVKCSELVKNHFENESGISYSLCPCFQSDGDKDDIDEFKLRLMIAISADGSKSRDSNWRIRLYKQDKIERLKFLLEKNNLKIDERIYEDKSHNFYIPIEYGCKEFPSYFYNLSNRLKNVFLDEIFRWDGSEDNSYYSTIKNNADICQFIISSLGYRTGYYVDDRVDENITGKDGEYKYKSICYRISILKSRKLNLTLSHKNKDYRDYMVQEFSPKDNKKYCFTVPSSCLVLRRNNQIFITGNCGKSTLTRWLSSQFECEIVDEYGRDYCAIHAEPNDGKDNFIGMDGLEEITYGHHKLVIASVRNAWKKKIKLVLVDTEHYVTRGFAFRYFNSDNKYIKDACNFQHYDGFIYCDLLPLEDDGTRRDVSIDDRVIGDKQLWDMITSNVKDGKIIRVPVDMETRKQMSIEFINSILKGE